MRKRTSKRFSARYGPWGIVVGASMGLGAAYVRALAARGLNVIAIARSAAKVEALCIDTAARWNVEAQPLVLDLLAENAKKVICDKVAGRDVGLLIYNTGFPNAGGFLQRSVASHRALFTLNSLRPLELVHALAPHMRARRSGGIVLMSSLTSIIGSPFVASYGATKAFNMVFGEGLSSELRGESIDVTVCCAGVIRPDDPSAQRTPTARLLGVSPARIARVTLNALGKKALVVPGLTNAVIFGVLGRLVPRRFAVRLMALTVRLLDIERTQSPQRLT